MDDVLIAPIIKKIVDDLNPEAIWIFGSYVRQEQNTESDLDIAVLERSDLSDTAWYMYAQKLAGSAGIDVDLIRMHKASTVLQNQVIRTGIRVYCINDALIDEYEIRRLKEYFWLNEERAGIVQDMLGGGRLDG